MQRLFDRFDAMLRAAGYIAMSGQIVDASLVAAPRQRSTQAEKDDIKAGGCRKSGSTSPPSSATRTAMHAGRSSSPRPSRARTAPCRRSIWRSRYSSTTATTSSIAGLASSANGRPRMRPPMRDADCAMACSTRATPRLASGPTRPIDRRRTRAFMADNGFVSRVHRNRRQLPRHRLYGVCLDLDVCLKNPPWRHHGLSCDDPMPIRGHCGVSIHTRPWPTVGGNRSRGLS
jgi:hypothetical protein